VREEDRTRDVGRHLLGPHAVGQRVVVRRVLPGQTGPTGGPALTDLLGDLVAWPDPDAPAEERYAVVLGADGTRTAIPLAEIVSGKPVPPRPSPRHRVSAREAERHVLALWPGIVSEPLGEWTLRTDPAPVGRLLKRANSCLALGDPGVPAPEAAARVRDFYRDRGREPLVQVELDSEVDHALAGLGWSDVPGGQAEFWIAPVAQVRRARRRAVVEAPEPWLEETDHRARAGLGPPAEPAASARAAIDRDWVGVHGLEVVVTQRRRGLASLVVDRLLEWAAERGATTAWLHVESDNAGAQALYAALGFAHHHTVRYLRAPG
jgi:GNAT superfamily N-acetyltransferase